jgi:hypothetical protein
LLLSQLPNEKRTCSDRIVIEPNSKKFFDLAIIALSLVTTVWAAFFAAFGFYKS